MGGSSKKQTVGYKYFMALHMALCYGPVDKLRRFLVGDREAWIGDATESSTLVIEKPDLFGGDKREGGINGSAELLMGEASQTLPSSVTSLLPSPAPAFRGVLSFFYNGQIGANNPYVKPFAFQVQRVLSGWSTGSAWYSAKAPILLSEAFSGPQAFYFTVDASLSMDETVGPGLTRLDVLKAALLAVLDFIEEQRIAYPSSRIDVGVTRWNSTYSSIVRYDIGAGDIAAVKSFVSGITTAFGTLFDQAWPGPVTFFTALNTAGVFNGARRCFFITDGEPDLSTVSPAQALAEDLLTRTGGSFRSDNGSAVDVYGINIGLSVTTYTALFDNTASDGVPVVADGDTQALIDAIRFSGAGAANSMNGAHIIYQCITDTVWGMGYPTTSIDTTTFQAAADTLYSEAFGLCLQWAQQDEIGSFIRQVLDHIGGVLYSDPQTGKFALRLLRGDYDVGTLPVFDETKIVDLESFQRVGYGDTVNQITVVYRDWETNKDVPITVHNLANIQAQGAVVGESRQYPGLPTAVLGARVAQRDLNASSTPLAKGRMRVNRSAWSLFPGGVFKLTWAKRGISSLIARVIGIDYGTLLDGTIVVDFAEDVFGLPASSYAVQEPGGWVEPDTSAPLVSIQNMVEVPYRSLVVEVGPADLALIDDDAAYLAALAAKPTSTSQGFDIYSRVGAAPYEQQDSGQFVPYATLSGAITNQTTSIPLATGVDLDDVEPDSLAIIGTGRDAEWVKVVSINQTAPSMVVSRAVLDTTPKAHASGSVVWFDDARSGNDTTERATGEVVSFKLATISTGGELDYNMATAMTATAEARQTRPYPPGNLQVNGASFPTTILVPLEITWAHRDRLQQTAYTVEQTEGDIGPEAGTTYSAYAYDDDVGTLLESLTGITGTSWTPSLTGNFRLRIEIAAVRGGIESWQRQIRIFDFNVALYKVPVTVPEASVASNLTAFPVWVDLGSMPAGFWDHVGNRDGRDIRVKDGSGTDLPFDLVNVQPIAKVGSLFVRINLSSSASTTFYIHYGSRALDFVAPAAANGRYAVWADYHHVYTFGDNQQNRASGTFPTQTNLGFNFENASTSASLSVHQGVCFDGTYYYVTDTNAIKKYTSAFSLVATNSDPCGDVGNGTNHCGDPEVLGGIIYVPIENYTNISTFSGMRIARFLASDLSFIDSVSIAAQGHEASSICYNARDGFLYVSSFNDGSKLWRYNVSSLAFVSALTLSATIPEIQGVTFWREAFWINSDNPDSTIRVELDGTVRNSVWGTTAFPGGAWEGIGHSDDGLLVLHDTTGAGAGVVRSIQRRDIAARDGGRFFGHFLEASVTRYTTWTMGVSVQVDDKSANRAALSYATSGSSDPTKRTTLAYRQSSDRFGFWNNTDSWLLDTVSPTVGVNYRLNVTHTGTTNRKIYRDGVLRATDTTVATMPPTGANALFVACSDASFAEPMDGKMGFAYLRNGELSADWIAAETLNIKTPGSFYTVGSEAAI